MSKPKLLILGYGRHGKDTVAELLEEFGCFNFMSSSRYAAEKVVYPKLDGVYVDAEECFNDRHNCRKLWYDLISEYNSEDPSKLAAEMLNDGYDMYVGMRSRREFNDASDLFDLIIWVDACDRIRPTLFQRLRAWWYNTNPYEPFSNDLNKNDADIVICNNGTIVDLMQKVTVLLEVIT